MNQKFEPAYMGEYLRVYKPPINLNRALGAIFSGERRMFMPLAVITREVQFPDVSFYQDDIDWDKMAENTKAVIIRIGQNLWPDTKFERNYWQAKARGLLVGGYWFYDGRVSPVQQADLLEELMLDKMFEMEVFVDWERNYGGRWEGLPNVVSMMNSIEDRRLDIMDVGMYTGYYFLRSNSNPITHRSQYEYLKTKPLWEAWYTSNPTNVLIPAPWTSLTHWQFGTPTVDWGQQTLELDMNFFNGSAREFSARYGAAEPIPTGAVVNYKITPDFSNGSKIRRDHSISSTQVGALAFGKYAFGSETSGGIDQSEYWLHIVEYENLQGGITALDGWVAARAGGAKVATITEIVVEPPPPPPPSDRYILYVHDGIVERFDPANE